MTIAAAQPPVTCDPAVNGAEIRALMRRAHDHGARLVHFPEGALSGYAGQDKQYYTGWDIDWVPVRRELAAIRSLAAQLGLWVVLGSNHHLTGENRPHNSLYVISDQGDIVNRYDKRYLSHTEITGFYSPGFAPATIDIDGYRFGLALCIEINFPEVFLDYLHRGADCPVLHLLRRPDLRRDRPRTRRHHEPVDQRLRSCPVQHRHARRGHRP
ncbi:carbon-nitrogen hydrolase family protein [Micromonospora sp. LOL_024]|uniref:carbon-nitrogen hydrolase family protein n=1 Tax=Micromonospora sp. LOL_024 TaxID=3345412 RepID=UPI003A88E063